MSEANQGSNCDASATLPIKRRRGRPRKYPKLDLVSGGDSHGPRRDNSNNRERSRVSPGVMGVDRKQHGRVDLVDNATDFMVGQTVRGVIEAAFDAGYLLTVRVGNSENILRGVIFKAGHYVPVSADNDVAPGVQMIRRTEISLPRENNVQAYGHNSQSKEANGTQAASPAASRGKRVVDARPPNGSTPTNQVQAIQTQMHFQFQNNHQVTPSGIHNEPGFAALIQEAGAKANPVTTQSTESDTSSAGKLSAKDSRTATEDVDESEQALTVEPLRAVQPDIFNHPPVLPIPLANYGTGKMTELLQVLQATMTENQAAQAQNATADPSLKTEEPEDEHVAGGHS